MAQASRACTRAHVGAPLMFGAGIIAGLLGIGAGAFRVLSHDLVMGLPPKVSTTTNNLIIGVTALAGGERRASSSPFGFSRSTLHRQDEGRHATCNLRSPRDFLKASPPWI